MSLSRFQNYKFLLLFFLFLSNIFGAENPRFSKEEQEWIASHPLVELGADYNWPPYEFRDAQGKHEGIAADYLKLIAQKSGLEFHVTTGVWSKILQKAKDGELDGLSCAVKTPDREEYLHFSPPYLSLPLALVVQGSNRTIKDIKDLEGKTIALNKGSYLHEWMQKNHPEIKLYFTTSNIQSLEALSLGKVDAYIGNIAVTTYMMQENFLSNLKIINTLEELDTEVSIAISKQKPFLQSIIDKSLAAITAQEKREILSKWYKNAQGYKEVVSLLSREERLWVDAHKKVRYSEVNWKPLSIIESGEMRGVIRDYLDIISKKTGLEFVFEESKSWPEVLEKFKNNQIDMVPGIGDSGVEMQMGLSSHTFATFPFVLVTNNAHTFINNIGELAGERIAVPKYWTSYNYLLAQHPEIEVIGTKDIFEALNLVKTGDADAFLGHLAVAMYYVGTYYPNSLYIAGNGNFKFNHKILLHRDAKQLLTIINKALDSLTEGEKLAIKNRWLKIEVKEAQDYTLLFEIAAVLLLMILASFYWNRKLSFEIQERKRVENALLLEKENFKTLFDKVADGNLILQNGVFILANDAALKMLALHDAEELREARPEDFSPEFQPVGKRSDTLAAKYIHSCLRKGSERFEWLHRDAKGKSFWVDVGLTKIHYQDTEAIYVVWRDISEQKELQKSLEQAREMADAANRSKSEFLANMSHEIRTPMNAIMGFTELLDEQLREERLKSYVKTIQNASNTLLTLINDILDLSKIEAGKLKIEMKPTNLFHLSSEISSIFMMSVKNKGLDFIVDVDKNLPNSLLIDEVRLRQILFNLIGNAVKFTESGYIKLSIKAFNIKEHLSKLDLEIVVADSGIGIKKDQLEKIFQEFEQQEGQDNRKFGGTGLGLSISKRLSMMMGGDISVESEKGAKFTVHLYNVNISSLESEVADGSDKREYLEFEEAKILVVDDIADNCELIIKNFEGSKIAVVSAADGVEAIECFNREKPDLILMDIRMPNMDGYEAAREIKKLSDIPIIALTASVMRDEHERVKSEDFDGYLRKPVLRNELFGAIAAFLEHKSIRKQKEEKSEQVVLSAKAKEQLSTLLSVLNEKVVPLHSKAIDSKNISDIKEMNGAIEKIASEYDVALLQKYAKGMRDAVDIFDIAKMERLLREFSEILERLEGER